MAAALLIAAAALATGGAQAADRGTKRLADAIAGHSPGKPALCVERSRLQGPDVIDTQTIIYRQSNRRLWVATLRGPCPPLRGDPVLAMLAYDTQLCRNDRFEVSQRGSPIASTPCVFASFTPYDRVKAP